MTLPASHAEAVHVVISDRIRVAHDLVAGLVAAGFAETGAADVEVHVKAAPVTVTRWVVPCRAGCDREANYDPGGAQAGHCARSRQRAQRLAGDPTVHDTPRQQRVGVPYAYHGRAYPEVPAVANTAPATRYLVTLRMPPDPAATADTHPRVSRYTRYATAPPVTLMNWREEIVHLAAHEARHVAQFRHHQPRSEIEAERYAHARLARWRTATQQADRAGRRHGGIYTLLANPAVWMSGAAVGGPAGGTLSQGPSGILEATRPVLSGNPRRAWGGAAVMGRGHALSGAAVWLVAAPPAAEALGAPLDAPAVLASAVVSAGASLLPDADHPQALAARSLGPVTQLLALVIHGLAGGHREATHSLAFCAAIAGITTAGLALGGHVAALVVAGVCTGLALRALSPQSLQGGRLVDVSFLAATLVLTGAGDRLVASTTWLPAAVTVGVATHLLGDFLAGEGGIPLFWPHPTRYAIPVLGAVGGLREHVATLALAGVVVLAGFGIVGS